MVSSMPFLVASKKRFLAAFLGVGALLSVVPAQAQTRSSDMEGTWIVQEKDGVFHIAPCPSESDRLCGWLIGMAYTDAEPEKDYRGVSECGMEIISSMKRRKNGHWHGKVLDPRTGRSYHANMWLAEDGTLKLRGYVGLALFGETQTWSRIVNPTIGERCRMKRGG